MTGFCLSPVIDVLLNDRDLSPRSSLDADLVVREKSAGTTGGEFEFAKDGDIENDDYAQSSIYSILYAMYSNTPDLVSPHGVKYQFTFNTWGVSPSPYPVEDPQRHGKAAYRALATQPAVMAYVENLTAQNLTAPLEIMEIGCGTAAGGNLITREVWPTSNYLALDMQAAAVNTCNRIHATEDNKGLTCLLVPGGVGNGGNRVRGGGGRGEEEGSEGKVAKTSSVQGLSFPFISFPLSAFH